MNFKFSIIIPHHNIPQLLERCLSTINRSSDIQVIVIDDKSDDKYIPEIKKLENQYNQFEFYFDKTGLGAGHARNIGLTRAKGDWIIFVDADDYLNSYSYEIWKEYTSKYQDYDILFFREICLDEQNNYINHNPQKVKSINRLLKRENELNKYLKYCFFQPWSKLFSRNFIKENNLKFQESLVANDMLFSITSGIRTKKVKYINQSFYNYIRREGSLSFNEFSDFNKILSRLLVYHKVQEIFIQQNIRLRPFSIYFNEVRKHLEKFKLIKLVDELRKYNIEIKHFKINYYRSLAIQIPRKIYELLHLPFSGL